MHTMKTFFALALTAGINPPTLAEYVTYGDHNQFFENVQRELVRDNLFPKSEISGRCSHEMVESVQRFQEQKGIAATGIIDEKTRSLLRLPKGLSVSITGFEIENATIKSSDVPVVCGASNDSVLEVKAKYTINWNFSDFEGVAEPYLLKRTITGNNGHYQVIQEESILPDMKGYKPGPCIGVSGTTTVKDDFTLSLKSNCKTTKVSGPHSDIVTKTLVVPQRGNYEFSLEVDGKSYKSSFIAR